MTVLDELSQYASERVLRAKQKISLEKLREQALSLPICYLGALIICAVLFWRWRLRGPSPSKSHTACHVPSSISPPSTRICREEPKRLALMCASALPSL